MGTNSTNHDIQIVNDHSWNWLILVDGKELKISKRLCHINLGKEDAIRSVLNSVEKVVLFRGGEWGAGGWGRWAG